MNEELSKDQEFRQLILNASQPLVFKNILKWDLLSWSLQNWSHLLSDRNLTFRCGKYEHTKDPQWERTNTTKVATFEEFINLPESSTEWMYFDYKHLNECFKDIPEFRDNIKWDFIGFPEIAANESTLWIGSQGAHTSCHADSYGCNLIAQIYGKKLWLVFPPEEDLKPSRIPYEESSIYSKLNFFSPSKLEEFSAVDNCRKIILEPGDVLFLPHKWWHYVENLETSISINTWLPLAADDTERLNEALVQFFISQTAKNMDPDLRNSILNPNSDKDILANDLEGSLNLVNVCIDKCLKPGKKLKTASTTTPKNINREADSGDILKRYKFIHQVPALAKDELLEVLKQQMIRFQSEKCNLTNNNNFELDRLINAFSHPEVVNLIREKMLHS